MRLKLAAESWETLGVEEQFEISGISGYIGGILLAHRAHFVCLSKSQCQRYVQRRQSCVSIGLWFFWWYPAAL